MARPRKEQDGPSALERMEAAFWEELEEKPYTKITVTDIVQKAHVNRNAFYYHHDDLDDLAHKAVSNLLLAGGANVIVELIGTEDKTSDEAREKLQFFLARKIQIKRARLIIGDHSSPELTNMLRQAILDNWSKSFGVDVADLDVHAQTTIAFVIGGIIDVFNSWEDVEQDMPQIVLESGLAEQVAGMLSDAFGSTGASNPLLAQRERLA